MLVTQSENTSYYVTSYYAAKIITVSNGFVVFTTNEPELDKVFNIKINKELVKEDFTPQIPLELKAKRSILIFKTDSYIFHREEETVKEDIEREIEWVEQITN